MYGIPGGRVVVADDYTFVIPDDQVGLIRFLLQHRHAAIEPGVQRLIRDRLKRGDVAVDVGANVGAHSLVMARAVGGEGRVVCFEPLERMADALRLALLLNGYARPYERRRRGRERRGRRARVSRGAP